MAVYQTVYLVDTHISLAATALLDRWVRRGGCLFGTVRAGSRDEIDRPNADASALFGLERPKSGAVLLAGPERAPGCEQDSKAGQRRRARVRAVRRLVVCSSATGTTILHDTSDTDIEPNAH